MLLIQSCDLRANMPYNNYNKGTVGRFLRLPHHPLSNKGVDLLHVPAAFQLIPHHDVSGQQGVTSIKDEQPTTINCSAKRKIDEEDATLNKKILKKSAEEVSPSNSPRREHSPPITGAFKCSSCTYTADKKSWLIEHMLQEHIDMDRDAEEDGMETTDVPSDDSTEVNDRNSSSPENSETLSNNASSQCKKPDQVKIEVNDKRPDQVKLEVNDKRPEQLKIEVNDKRPDQVKLEVNDDVPDNIGHNKPEDQAAPITDNILPTHHITQNKLVKSPKSSQGSPRSVAHSPKTTCSLSSPEMSPGQLEYTCEQCDISFSSESTYQAHKQFYCGLRSKRLKTETGYTLLPAMMAPAIVPAPMTSAIVPTPMITPFGMTYAVPYIVPVASPIVSPPNKEKTKKPNMDEEPLDLSCRKPTRAVLNHVIRPAVSRCDQCNIVFYKHENYMVHKQHYCAGRRKTPISPITDKSPSISPVSSSPPTNRESATLEKSEEYTVQYFCLPCKIQFSSPDTLEAHQQYYCPSRNLIGSNEPTECPHCDLEFVSVEELSKHLCTHTTMKIPMYCCPYCQYVAQSDSRLLDHIKSHAPTKAYRCTLCGYRGNTVRGMRMHGKSHLDAGEKFTDDNMVEYEEPPLIPKRLRTITESVSIATDPLHLTNERKRLRSKSSSSSCEDIIGSRRQAPHICVECNSIFIDTNKLRLHMQLHLEDKYFKCNLCDFIAEIKEDLLHHVKTAHKTKQVKNSSKYTIENLINICPQEEQEPHQLEMDTRTSQSPEINQNPNRNQTKSPVVEDNSSPTSRSPTTQYGPNRFISSPTSRSPTTQYGPNRFIYHTKVELPEQKSSEVRTTAIKEEHSRTDNNGSPCNIQQSHQFMTNQMSPENPTSPSITPTSPSTTPSSPGTRVTTPTSPKTSVRAPTSPGGAKFGLTSHAHTKESGSPRHVPADSGSPRHVPADNGPAKLDIRTEDSTTSHIGQSTNYCSQCDIKFVYLSTFLAHKKYYCSSHAGEKRANSIQTSVA